jgi:hypothetical protein
MNDYQNPFANDLAAPAYGQQPQKPQKNWFGRNWFWFVPLIILLPIFCCCGGGGALVWFGLKTITNETPYKDSVVAAQQNPEVQAALGTPIEVGGFMGIPTDGSEPDYQPGMYMIINIPIDGPNGSATIFVDATTTDGVNWTYTRQEVELPDGTVIDLQSGGASSEDTDELEAIEESPSE